MKSRGPADGNGVPISDDVVDLGFVGRSWGVPGCGTRVRAVTGLRPTTERTVEFRPLPGRSFQVTGAGTDLSVIGEIERSGGFYQADMVALLRRYLRPDSVVIDAGAHVGVITLVAASLCPDGHVYAFEPSPETHGHLVANLAANQAANVTPVAAAVHEADGTLSFNIDEANPSASAVTAAPGVGGASATTSVDAVRLDTWVSQQALARLDFIKLDVEGAELAALAGMAETLTRFRPVLAVECNPIALRRFGGRAWTELLATLQAIYPTVAVIGEGGSTDPVMSEDGLRQRLGQRGVLDLVALPDPPARAALAPWRPGRSAARRPAQLLERLPASLAGWVRARQGRNDPVVAPAGDPPTDGPPGHNFVIEPVVTLTASVADLTGAPGELIGIPVTISNRSRFWLSTAFPHHPVHVSYRFADPEGTIVVPNGHRIALPVPLAPGATNDIHVTVELPADPGRYELRLTLVQDGFAWFDDVEPGSVLRLPVTVTSSSS